MLKLDLEQLLTKIAKKLTEIASIQAIILFGSISRKDYSSKSDIDLLVIVDSKKEKDRIETAIAGIPCERRIQPLIRKENELGKMDIGLLNNILNEGRLLFVRRPLNLSINLLMKQAPYTIITFNLKKLKQTNKVKFNTALYGVDKQKYNYTGILKMVGGKKLGDGCILVPSDKKKSINELFATYNIAPSCIDVWINK